MPIVIIPSPYMSTARDAVQVVDSALLEMIFSTCTAYVVMHYTFPKYSIRSGKKWVEVIHQIG